MIAAAFLLAMQGQVQPPAGCGVLVDRQPHRVSCMRRGRPDRTRITGPVRLCSRHFAVTLRPGDVFASTGDASRPVHVLTARDGRTIRFGDEMFAADMGDRAAGTRVRRRGALQPSGYPGSSAIPYFLHERRGRYVLPHIDGTQLDGTPRDAVPLARLAARTPATRCDRAIDLGTIGYSDDSDFSTMAAR